MCDETYDAGVGVWEVVVNPWRVCICVLGLAQVNPKPPGVLHVAFVGTTGVWNSAVIKI